MVERVSLDDFDERTKQPVFESQPRTVRVRLEAGEEITEHEHPDKRILFHVLEGELELSLDDESYALTDSDLLRFDGNRTISGIASEPTTVLVVLIEKSQ